MFEHDFDLRGKHATFTKILSPRELDDENKIRIFARYIDVYMVGAIIGLLHNRRAERDTSNPDNASILAGAFATERSRCIFIYRLIMLLDESSGLTAEERIDRAFRVDGSMPDELKGNMDLFHRYVYGGIEVLHEKFTDNCTTKDDYIDRIHENIIQFDSELDTTSYEELIKDIINQH